MITASIVTYNNNLLDLEGILRSLLISPVQKVWIIDHSDTFLGLGDELKEYKKRDDEYVKHESRGFQLEYMKEANTGYASAIATLLFLVMYLCNKFIQRALSRLGT